MRAEGGEVLGTGFIVADGTIITAAHVVDRCRAVQIVDSDQHLSDVREVEADSALDLAVLHAPLGPGSTGLSFRSDEKAEIGEPVYAVGFSLQKLIRSQPSFVGGFVAGSGGINNDPAVFRLGFVPLPGMSGAAVLDDAGLVLGLVKSQIVESAGNGGPALGGEGFVISATSIAQFLRDKRIAFKQESRRDPSELRPGQTKFIAKKAQASTVLTICLH